MDTQHANFTASFLERHNQKIDGVLSCFDRVVVFGSFREISYPRAMEWQCHLAKCKYADYAKKFAEPLRCQMSAHMRELAKAQGVKITVVNYADRKEDIVQEALEKRGDHPGIVMILGAMERCRCYKTQKNHATGYLELGWDSGKCFHYYVYFVDEEFGLCHLRIPTWAPFRLQFCFNGHNWLERRLRAKGISFEKVDNCFVNISDYRAAQALVDEFAPETLHTYLNKHAERFVAIYKRWGEGLHWSIAQAEWATDIVFADDTTLPVLYDELLRTAMAEVKCEDVYQFMGKRLTQASAQEVSSRLQTRIEGTRIKHTLGKTSVKMYDKFDRVLRIETTCNDVTMFKHRREVIHQDGTRDMQMAPLKKTIYSLGALAEQMLLCNRRYLRFISEFRDHTQERTDMRKITQSTRDAQDRSYRGLNFFHTDDLAMLCSLLQGEHQIQGFSNRQLQARLAGWNSGKISRFLKRFRMLGLIKRVGRTYRYYLTKLGSSVLIAALQLKERIILPALAKA